QRLERVELEPVEVVEAVDEHGRAPPLPRTVPKRVERAASVQLGIHEPGGLEALAVRAVDRRDLLGVLAAGAVGGPIAQGARETRGTDLVANLPQLGEE